MEGNLALPRHRREGLGPASNVVADSVDTPWETSPSLSSGWEWGERKVGEQKDRTGGKGNWK